jgi:hypothetical protein
MRNEVKQCQGLQAGRRAGAEKAGAMTATVERSPANSGERPKALWLDRYKYGTHGCQTVFT